MWESQEDAEPTIMENTLSRFIEAAEMKRGSDQVEILEFLLLIPSLLAAEAANQATPLLSLPAAQRSQSLEKTSDTTKKRL